MIHENWKVIDSLTYKNRGLQGNKPKKLMKTYKVSKIPRLHFWNIDAQNTLYQRYGCRKSHKWILLCSSGGFKEKDPVSSLWWGPFSPAWMLFPRINFHFGRPKTSKYFQKWKAKGLLPPTPVMPLRSFDLIVCMTFPFPFSLFWVGPDPDFLVGTLRTIF